VAKLTEGHLEQIKNMDDDGKKALEIIEFFKSHYKIRLNASEISRAIHGKYKAAPDNVASADEPKQKRKYTRRAKKAVAQPQLEKSSPDEFVSHIHAAWNIHKKDFLARVEEALAKA
jgi:hypothetical protein